MISIVLFVLFSLNVSSQHCPGTPTCTYECCEDSLDLWACGKYVPDDGSDYCHCDPGVYVGWVDCDSVDRCIGTDFYEGYCYDLGGPAQATSGRSDQPLPNRQKPTRKEGQCPLADPLKAYGAGGGT